MKALGRETELAEFVNNLYLSLRLREIKDSEYLTWKIGEMVTFFIRGACGIHKIAKGIYGTKRLRTFESVLPCFLREFFLSLSYLLGTHFLSIYILDLIMKQFVKIIFVKLVYHRAEVRT